MVSRCVLVPVMEVRAVGVCVRSGPVTMLVAVPGPMRQVVMRVVVVAVVMPVQVGVNRRLVRVLVRMPLGMVQPER